MFFSSLLHHKLSERLIQDHIKCDELNICNGDIRNTIDRVGSNTLLHMKQFTHPDPQVKTFITFPLNKVQNIEHITVIVLPSEILCM